MGRTQLVNWIRIPIFGNYTQALYGDKKLTRRSSAQVSSQALSLKSKSIKLKSRRIIEEQQAHQTRAVLAKNSGVHQIIKFCSRSSFSALEVEGLKEIESEDYLFSL